MKPEGNGAPHGGTMAVERRSAGSSLVDVLGIIIFVHAAKIVMASVLAHHGVH